MIKLVLFDADRVVINLNASFRNYRVKELGIPDEATLVFFENEFQECLIGKADLFDVLSRFLRKWGWSGSTKDFVDLWFSLENQVDSRMISLVDKLRRKGVTCVIATAQEKYRTKYIRENMKIEKYFDFIFSTCDIGYLKTDKEFYQKILENYPEIKPKEVLFVDDDKKNLETAKKLKINTFLYTDFKKLIKNFQALSII